MNEMVTIERAEYERLRKRPTTLLTSLPMTGRWPRQFENWLTPSLSIDDLT